MAVFVIAKTRDDTTGRAHQASVYPRRILMRRVSRGSPANACTDIHKPNYPLSLCITSNSRYSVTSALNNRETVQFASFATKACEFNEKVKEPLSENNTFYTIRRTLARTEKCFISNELTYLRVPLFVTLSHDGFCQAIKSIRTCVSARFIILREPAPLFRNNGCTTICLRITSLPRDAFVSI